MDIKLVHKLEKAIIHLLALDGWKLKWTGKNYEHCDAVGLTPKGVSCALEIKIRRKWYQTKLIEKYKYDKLMQMPQDAKFYFVSDDKGNYLYWLNDIKLPPEKDMYCPDTTLWTKKKVLKPCYLLDESMAHIINYN